MRRVPLFDAFFLPFVSAAGECSAMGRTKTGISKKQNERIAVAVAGGPTFAAQQLHRSAKVANDVRFKSTGTVMFSVQPPIFIQSREKNGKKLCEKSDLRWDLKLVTLSTLQNEVLD